MLARLRSLVVGRPVTRPVTERELRDEKALWWQRPQEIRGAPAGRTWILFGVAPGWKLCVNHYTQADAELLPDPHFHGGRLLALILRGGYTEQRVTGFGADARTTIVRRRPGRLNWIPLDVAHTILRHERGDSWTLLLIFPTVQSPGLLDRRDGARFKSFGRYFGERAMVVPTS